MRTRLTLAAAFLALLAGEVHGATVVPKIRYAPDVTTVLSGTTVSPAAPAEDSLAGTVTPISIGTIPDGARLDGCAIASNGDQLLSFDTALTLGGTTFDRSDIVRYDGTSYTLEFSSSSHGVPDGTNLVDFDVYGSGFLLVYDTTFTAGGGTFGPRDVVLWDPSVPASFSSFPDAAAAGIPDGVAIDGLHRLATGHLLLSFDASGTVGGIAFGPQDILEYAPGLWDLFYDGSAKQPGGGWTGAILGPLAVPCDVPTARVSGSATICAGGSAIIRAALAGAGPWNVTWSDGIVQSGVLTSPATRTVSPVASTTYTVTSFGDAICNGAGAGTGSAVVTVQAPPVFAGLSSVAATTGGTCGLRLDWVSGSSGLVYDVYRAQTNPFTPGATNRIASCVTGTFYVDTAVASATTYDYIVRAEGPGSGLGGACNGGCEDANTKVMAGTAPTCGTSSPSDVIALAVTSAGGTNVVQWANPGGSSYTTTRIVRRSDRYPNDPADVGTAGTIHEQAGTPGAVDTWTDGSLVNGTTYYYGVWVYSAAGATYSSGRFRAGRPMDTTGPVKWAYSTGASSLAPPGIGYPAAGVYATSNDRNLHAMRAGTAGGTWPATWKPTAMNGPAQSRPPVVTTAAVPGATRVIFLGSQDGYAYAFNADRGDLLWRSPLLGDAAQGGPSGIFMAYGGAWDLVVAGSWNAAADNELYALKAADGTIAWTFDNTPAINGGIGVIAGTPSIDYTNKRIVFASRQRPGGSLDTVWCLSFDAVSATKVWSRNVGDVDGSVIVAGGVAYVGTNGGTVQALDAATGIPRWTGPFTTGDGPVKAFVWRDYATGRLYFSTTGKVWSVTDGGGSATAYWSTPVTIPSPSNPLLYGGFAYVGGGDGKLYEIDASSPTPAAPRSVVLGDGTAAVGSPSLDVNSGLLHVGTDAGIVYAVQGPLP